MKAFLYDSAIGEVVTGTIEVDYFYQLEEWVIDLERTTPSLVLIGCPEIGITWLRNENGKFILKESLQTPLA